MAEMILSTKQKQITAKKTCGFWGQMGDGSTDQRSDVVSAARRFLAFPAGPENGGRGHKSTNARNTLEEAGKGRRRESPPNLQREHGPAHTLTLAQGH